MTQPRKALEGDRLPLGEVVGMLNDHGVVKAGLQVGALPGWDHEPNRQTALAMLTVGKRQAGQWLASLQRPMTGAVDVWAFGKHYGCPVTSETVGAGGHRPKYFKLQVDPRSDKYFGPTDGFDGKPVPAEDRIPLFEFANLFGEHARVLPEVFNTGRLLDFDDPANLQAALNHFTVDRLTVACWHLRWLPSLDPSHPVRQWSEFIPSVSTDATLQLFSPGA